MDYHFHYIPPTAYFNQMPLTISSNENTITGLWFKNQKYHSATLPPNSIMKECPIFKDISKFLDQYFSGKIPDFTIPFSPSGSIFQQQVWKVLEQIPYGELVTYGEIASIIGKQRGVNKMSAQAIGGAIGHNPISILIPCHRVIGRNSNLTGYASGLTTKIQLLKLEGISLDFN